MLEPSYRNECNQLSRYVNAKIYMDLSIQEEFETDIVEYGKYQCNRLIFYMIIDSSLENMLVMLKFKEEWWMFL